VVTWLAANERDLVIAFIFAIIGAIVWDVLKTGSLTGVRQLRNRLSNVSVSRLQKRIKQVETYRDRIASFGSSDKALYLAVLLHVVGMLTTICMAIILLIFEYAAEVSGAFSQSPMVIGPRGGFATLGAGALGIAVLLGLNATKLATLNTRETVLKKVTELDSEIAGLKAKLDARLARQTALH
jgi:hypothetical protein